MIVQVKPRTPEDAPSQSFPQVRQVWYLPNENSLFFHNERGAAWKFSLEHHEIQILDEPRWGRTEERMGGNIG